MLYRLAYARINSNTSASTSCKNLVKITPVTTKENSVKGANCAVTRLQSVDRHLFGTLAFPNGLEYHNFDFGRLISCHFSCQNLVRFSSVTTEFETRIFMAGVENIPRFVQLCSLGRGAIRHCGYQ